MALSIVNNPTAIGAQGGVNNVNNALAKTIKSLSTGLRINTAADDASGLAVSEKLRAQISGLAKAATNAQDAISMLQTAEGAMGSMTSMVQRIRELAVQAGDPAYTTNDRAMLQLEVDQLKDEIDRVSNSAEFNTKKLLNGDAAALWSASTDDIEAIVKGAPAEGNYKLTYDVDPGRNSVYKSNIMRIGTGEMSYDINIKAGNMEKLDNIKGMMREEDVKITISKIDITNIASAGGTLDANNMTDVDYLSANNTIANTDTAFYIKGDNGFVKLTATGITATGATINGTAITAGKSVTMNIDGVDYVFTHNVAGTNVTVTRADGTAVNNVYAIMAVGENIPADGNVTVVSKGGNASLISFTGNSSSINTVAGQGLNTMKVTGPSYVEMEVTSDAFGSAAQTFQMKVRVRDAETGVLSDWEEITIGTDGKVIGDNPFFSDGTQLLTGTPAAGQFKKGDKILAQVGGATELGTVSELDTLKANGTGEFGKVQVGTSGATVVVKDLTSPVISKTTTVYTAQMDAAGNVYYGQFDITLDKGAISSGTISVDILGEGDVASKYTKLSQLAQFTNSDGRMVLSNTQEITIYAGNGKTAKVTLEGSDTIADLEAKLSSAIIEQLNMGADGNNINAKNVDDNLVKYVETPTGGDHAVQGTFVIQTAVLGEDSNLTFVGDEAVLSALGVTQIQEAADSALNVRVTDAHTGEFIGEDIITDGRLRNVIQGVDVNIAPESASDIDFIDGKMVFTDKPGSQIAYLHIKDNATKAAVGANEGQLIDISIGRLDTVSMGIEGVNVATFDGAQQAISKLDMALEQISAARATAGAQMNRLEYTINNLNTTRENMVAAESRIRDLDMAQASSDLASQQVLLQSATAMLAQANQIPSYATQLLQ